MPRIVGPDSDIVRKMFLEATQAVGCTAIYHEVKTLEEDIYNDPSTEYLEPLTLDVLFDENPKVRVLKDLGWYNEDEEIRPLLIYLPIYKNLNNEVLNVIENSLVEIVYLGINKKRTFRITTKRLDSLFGNYWICKCVPERNIQFRYDPSDGLEFLNVNRSIDSSDSSAGSDTTAPTTVQELDIAYADDTTSIDLSAEESASIEDFFSDGTSTTTQSDTGSSEDYSSLVMG